MNSAIEIKNYSYKYADGVCALKDVNFSVGHGERIALIGPNGAGKSTLILAMCGFLQGTGDICIDGLKVNKSNIRKIRSLLGLVMQSPDDQLFMPTLFDDVAFGPLNMGLETNQIRKRVEDTLEKVGLSGMGNRAPHHFSAGQKRCAAIATVLSMNPKIITMDEPDSSLDPRSRGKLINLLRGLEQTLIIATCNMDFVARLCTRAILMDSGQIIADGPVRSILADSALMQNHGLEK